MKEEEIRPRKIFDEYLRLAEEDARRYFNNVELESSGCPACETEGVHAFTKFDFKYETCPNCLSLFVNPRPKAEAFEKYYIESPSSEFWATTFYKETAQARSEKLWKPKAKQILEVVQRHSASHHSMIDIGGGYGLFAEEIWKLSGQAPLVIEPSPHLAAVCRDKSLSVVEKFLEDVVITDLPEGPKTFVSFELFEHLHNPLKFLQNLSSIMSKGDLFIFTTLSGSGVDIQILWENSKSVSPPHHLNFFNPRSIAILLNRCGFENIIATTPGKLDVDILVNNSKYIKDRFWRSFVTSSSEDDRKAWQDLISATGWSSHMMVACLKSR